MKRTSKENYQRMSNVSEKIQAKTSHTGNGPLTHYKRLEATMKSFPNCAADFAAVPYLTVQGRGKV